MCQSYSRSDTQIIVCKLKYPQVTLWIILYTTHNLIDTLISKVIVIKVTKNDRFTFIGQKEFEELSTFMIDLTVSEDETLDSGLIVLDTSDHC